MDYKIIPGILRTTEAEYKKDIETANQFTPYVQIDVIDGVFAPQKTVERDIIAKYPPKGTCEVDLMVQAPENIVYQYLSLPFVDKVVIHVESTANVQSVIDTVHQYNKKCALALNPATPIELIRKYEHFDQITFMTVIPGRQGQSFHEEVLEKITEAKLRHQNIPFEVDGGMNPQTVPKAKEAGANLFVVGSYIFWSDDPKQRYDELVAKLS